jgi:Flp pilus assembly protein TadG
MVALQKRIPGKGRGRKQRGHAAVEAALMAPWIFVLFIVVLDLGMYSYAVIATQNAARSAVMHTSRSSTYVLDLTGACQIALNELRGMPNVPGSLATCAASAGAVSNSQPIAVVVSSFVAADLQPAARVAVTYRSPQMFPIPGLAGRLTVTRIVEARVLDN